MINCLCVDTNLIIKIQGKQYLHFNNIWEDPLISKLKFQVGEISESLDGGMDEEVQ